METTDFSYLSLFIWVGLGFIAGFFVYLLKRKGNQPENEVQQIENDWEDFAYSQVTKSNNHLKGLEQFLDQVEFPISNRDLIRHAEKNLTDGRKLNLLERLPDHIYQTKAEILDKLKPLINLSGG